MKQHMVIIGVDQTFSTCDLYEHRCTEKIKNLHKSAGKCDYQQQWKVITEADIVSNT